MDKFLLLILFLFPASLFAQNSISLNTEVYPAGVVSGARFDFHMNENLTLTSRIGYNFTDRKDYGKNDNEEGGGSGFGVGFITSDFITPNLSAHIRTDLWFMDIDWEQRGIIICDPEPCPGAVSRGTSEISVLQPTIGLEYKILFSENFFLKPTLSFGYEINIKTKGRQVGEGAILLGGFNFGYDF